MASCCDVEVKVAANCRNRVMNHQRMRLAGVWLLLGEHPPSQARVDEHRCVFEVVVVREGRRWWRNIFYRLTKGPALAMNEFGAREIEIVEGVALSTPSATHLMGLPHQGSPRPCSYPSTFAPVLRNKAHVSRWGGALEKWNGLCKQAKKKAYIWGKNDQKRYKINNNHLQRIFKVPRPQEGKTRGEESEWWWWFEKKITT